ncbi:Flagellar basal body rod protein FlgB [Rosistilla carotiformis]|uniref:Flagellar basal body rod protein FlgB n=1 Tax=Rosistilla carotiformis TaxID=2528017 RepID=A0A518JNB9_9BACT|nr:flagellar basal body protein [Rosistilla carotiformis]QDV67042.1 Flagellar basal body rod protein FlgB [Rosistilla carotiformis]
MLNIFNQTTLPALEQSAIFAQRRHNVLAGNMANIDTPGYQARDLSTEEFETALAEAIEATRNPSPGYNLGDAADVDPMDGPRRAMENLLYHDGSEINLERQVTEIAKNQNLHNTAIALMKSQFETLRVAISERV